MKEHERFRKRFPDAIYSNDYLEVEADCLSMRDKWMLDKGKEIEPYVVLSVVIEGIQSVAIKAKDIPEVMSALHEAALDAQRMVDIENTKVRMGTYPNNGC